MAMPAPPPLVPDTSRRDWTAAEVDALPDDGNRYEVIDGSLVVTPSPSDRHQDAVGELYVRIKPYADALRMHAFMAPTQVRFSDRRVVQPDLLVLPPRDGRQVSGFGDVGRLALAVEVLSPSTMRVDRYVKRRLFAAEGVPDYWIVDPASRVVERWGPWVEEPDVVLETLTWHPEPSVAPLVIDLRGYFRAVFNEQGM